MLQNVLLSFVGSLAYLFALVKFQAELCSRAGLLSGQAESQALCSAAGQGLYLGSLSGWGQQLCSVAGLDCQLET